MKEIPLTKLSTLLLLQLIVSATLFASQSAIVKGRRAILYAGPDLKVKIGYLNTGQEITVGDKLLGHEKAMATTVSGKIAYISVDDISLVDKLAPTSTTPYHQIHGIPHIPDEDFTPISQPVASRIAKGGASLGYHRFVVNNTMEKSLGEAKNGQLVTLELEIWPWSFIGAGVGGFYSQVKGNEAKLTMSGFEGSLYISVPFHSLFNLNGSGSLLLSPSPFSWEDRGGKSYVGGATGYKLSLFAGFHFEHMELRPGVGIVQLKTGKLSHEIESGKETVKMTLSNRDTADIHYFLALMLYI